MSDGPPQPGDRSIESSAARADKVHGDPRIRLLVEATHDAFLEIDSDGVITEWNPSAETLFGWPRDEAIGRKLESTIFPSDSLARFRQAASEVARDRRIPSSHKRVELQAARRDGGKVTIELTLWAVDVDGETRLNAFAHDLSERLRFQEELRQLAIAATTDQGTGLKNRRGFFALAEHELSVAQRLGQTLTLMFFDLDRLKTINDSQGHLEGDRAIADAAEILKATFRESDLLARLGGDEFCVLALGSETAVENTIKRLDAAIERHNATAGRPYTLSLSYGVAFYDPRDSSSSLDDLISSADASMYESKLGRDRSA